MVDVDNIIKNHKHNYIDINEFDDLSYSKDEIITYLNSKKLKLIIIKDDVVVHINDDLWLRDFFIQSLPDIKFGMELEFGSTLRSSAFKDIMSYNCGIKFAGSLEKWSGHGKNISYSDWNVTYDSSISVEGYPNRYEIVTPILYNKDIETLYNITNVLGALQYKNYMKINDTCGSHVHIQTMFSKVSQLSKLLSFWSNNHDSMKYMYKTNRSRCRYCLPIKENNMYKSDTSINFQHDRNCVINVRNFLDNNTIENRFMEGTVDFCRLMMNLYITNKKIYMVKEINEYTAVSSSPIEYLKLMNVDKVVLNYYKAFIFKNNRRSYKKILGLEESKIIDDIRMEINNEE